MSIYNGYIATKNSEIDILCRDVSRLAAKCHVYPSAEASSDRSNEKPDIKRSAVFIMNTALLYAFIRDSKNRYRSIPQE